MAVEADLPYCVKLLPDGLRLDPELRKRLPELWTRLLAIEAKSFAIIEDLSRPYSESIEAFGLSVFLTDTFAEQFCANPHPFFPVAFYKRMLAGDDIGLSSKQLADANATDGINVAVLHFGLRDLNPMEPRTAAALATGSAAFYFFHAGHRVRMFIHEIYGPALAQFVIAGGFQIWRDFQKETPANFDAAKPETCPYLAGLRREDVAPGAVNPLSQLFYPQPPRLGFSRGERHLLERALLNESDPSIAKSFNVSIDAVKKTWANIYARVARTAPFLIPGDPHSSGIRGEEKRRHVLDYVRTHPEELRTFRAGRQ
jgi:hypothetical protein